jgi:hypothetical protein
MATLSLVTSPAVAADPASTRAFDEGRELLTAGDVAGAKARFRASVDIEPTVGALLNLAECHAKLKEAAFAYRRYREAEALATKTNDDRKPFAHTKAEALKAELGFLDVRLPVDTPSATLTVDDEEVGRIAGREELPLEARAHRVEVTAGDRRFVTTKSLSAGESSVLEVRWPPKAEAATPSRKLAVPSYVSIGVGAAGIAAGAVFGALALGKKSDLHELCPSYPTCPPSQRGSATSAYDTAGTYATVSTVTVIAGAALVGTGIALYFFLSPKKTQAAHALRVFAGGASF